MALFQYNQNSIVPFSSIDYGFINETPTTPSEDHGDLAVVAQTTIAPDDIVSTYSGSLNIVTIANTGTGVGEYGGFNVGRHIKFTGTGTRSFNFAFDTSNREEITFSVIRGTDSNGGELPDTGEDLLFEYSTDGGSTWTGTQTLVAYNDAAFDTLNDVTVTLPTAAKVSNAQFRIRQASNSGSNYDQWGVTAVTIGGEILTTEDYQFLTPNKQSLPYGRLKVITEFANESLVRESVGGFGFLLFGRAAVQILPIHSGGGLTRLFGLLTEKSGARELASGSFSAFGGSAQVTTNRQTSKGLFRISGFSTEKNSESYVGVGSLKFAPTESKSKFISATRPAQGLFGINGESTVKVQFHQTVEGNLPLVSGSEQSNRRIFDYNTDSVVNVEGIDYGLITDVTADQKISDYANAQISTYANEVVSDFGIHPNSIDDGFISIDPEQSIHTHGANHVDYGSIATTNRFPFGGFQFEDGNEGTDSARIRFQLRAITTGPTFRLAGQVGVFVLPIHFGGGYFKFIGEGVETNTENHVGKGSLFGFVSSTESTVVRGDSTTLFRFVGESTEKNAEIHVGKGSLFGFVSKTESSGITEKSKPQKLFTTSGEAEVLVRYHQTGAGSLFSLASTSYAERVVFDYNEDSIVNVEHENYGFITAATADEKISNYANEPISNYANEVVFNFGQHPNSEDFGSISIDPEQSINTHGHNHEDYGVINTTNRFPYGGFQFEDGNEGTDSANIRFQLRAPTDGPVFQVQGEASIFVLPVHVGGGTFNLSGKGIDKHTEVYSGKGSLFGFVSSTEATVIKSTSSGLFSFNGSAEEKNTETHVGTGSLFTFVSKTESTVIQSKSQALFRFTGAITNEHVVFSQLGTGKFSTFSGTSYHERVAFDYNEDSIVNVEHENYGFVTSATADQKISDYANQPISNYANEVVFDFGIHPNSEDYGHISIDPEQSINTHGHNHEDYGVINTTNRFPYGGFQFEDQNDGTDTSDIKFQLRAPTSGTEIQLRGVAKVFVLPIHVGRGVFNIEGAALDKHTENYVGKGALFGFVSSTESTVVPNEVTGLFSFSGSAVEKNTENYVGDGNFSTFTGAAEAKTNVQIADGLFRIAGAATNEQVVFAHNGTGSLFGIVGSAESVTFDYNCHSSIVNIGADNYGFISESISDQTISDYANDQISTYANEVVSDFGLDPRAESFGHISLDPEQSINTHQWRQEDYGLITEPEGGNKFPCVHIQIGGTAAKENFLVGHPGSGVFSAFGGAAEVVAQTDDASGLFKIQGTVSIGVQLSHIGEGETNYQMPFNLIPFRDGDVVTQAYDLAYGIGSIVTNTVFTERSGTGSGPTGGFAIGSHIRFGGNSNGTRSLKFRLDLSNSETINIAAIKGNGSNGGEEPDANENLLIRFTGVSGTQTVVSENDITFNSLKEVVINVPVDARVENQEIEIYQQSNSGYLYDHYGVKHVRTTLQRFSSTNESITPAGEIGDAQIRFLDLAQVDGVRVAFDFAGSGTLHTSGKAHTTFHLGHPGSVLLDVNGDADTIRTRAYAGSGSLFAFTGGAESLTKDIPETATLFRFAGNGIEKSTDIHVGRGSLFGFVSKTESTSSAEQPTVLFNIEGDVVPRVLFHYPGSGTFSAFTGAAEARAVTKQAGGLFKFHGESQNRRVFPPNVGEGSLFTFVGKTETFTAADDQFSPPLFKVGGDATIGFSLGIIGRGGLDVLQKVTRLDVEGKNRFIGAEERRAVNNPASVLFTLDGTVKIFFVFQEVGGGFTRVAGEAFTEVTPRHTGRGKASIHGDVTMSASLSHIGSGTIFGFIGGAESRAVDLPPQKGLLRFAGTSEESFTRGAEIGDVSLQLKSSDVFVRFKLSHISDGSRIHVDGDGAEARVRLYEGAGSLFGFSGATESRVIDLPPQIPALFDFNGNSGERETNAHQGTGSLFGFDSATEVRTASPELSGLFKVQGTGSEAKTKVFTGSGTFDLNTKRDGVDVSGKQVYISAPESITVNPPEETQVFSFTGASVTKELRSHTGTGSLFGFTGAAESRGVSPDSTGLFKVQGSGEESRSRIYTGTGRVFGFTGGAEATAITENVPGSLFKLTGTVEVLFQRAPFIGSGSLFSFTGSTETTAVVPPVATLFEFSGNSAESRTRTYRGSGTLVTFQSATLARRVPYNATQGLFKLAGALRESFVPSGYVGTTGVQFIGASADRRIEFESPKPTQIYIV